MRQIAQPRGLVDRRARVVALVAQLHVAGVHPDAQLDRREIRPLQLQRARHRVAGARERRDEAVALALLDGADAVVLRDEFRGGPIHARDRGRHRLRLGLPQLGRALDVGKQQRHRAGRQQLGHVNVAPLSRAHASQHAPPVGGKTSAQRRIYAPSSCAFTPQGGWSCFVRA